MDSLTMKSIFIQAVGKKNKISINDLVPMEYEEAEGSYRYTLKNKPNAIISLKYYEDTNSLSVVLKNLTLSVPVMSLPIGGMQCFELPVDDYEAF